MTVKKTNKKTKKSAGRKPSVRKQAGKKDAAEKTAAQSTPPLTARQKKAEKRRKLKYIALGVFVFVSFIIWLGFQPLKGGINYGICRSYIETQIRYPNTYTITEYYEIRKEDSIIQKGDHESTVKIFFTHIDPYGGTRADMIECQGRTDPQNGYIMEDVLVNRVPVSKEELAMFNSTIPGILLGKPDLVIPRPPKSEDLSELKRD